VLFFFNEGSDPKLQSSLELEGAMVDKAIENVLTLPQEFQEAMSMQKLQNNEIAKFEKYLSSILVSFIIHIYIPYILDYKLVFWKLNFGPKVFVRIIGGF
jgi:hypothetical protein